MKTGFTTRRYFITGSQRLSSSLWASLLFLGGFSFLLSVFLHVHKPLCTADLQGSSAASYVQSLAYKSGTQAEFCKTISFFPQGLIMCFYGSLSLFFGVYLWCIIIWKVGSGFNEFNKDLGVVRIFRWGLPGKNRRIDLIYNLQDVEVLKVELKEGINPSRTLSLQIKGKKEIPLTRIGEPIALEEIESEASDLAQFLQVSLETLYST